MTRRELTTQRAIGATHFLWDGDDKNAVVTIRDYRGNEFKKTLPITYQQAQSWYYNTLIQDAFPLISNADREMLISGATPEEWDRMFGNNSQED